MRCFHAVGLASLFFVLASLARAVGAGGKDKGAIAGTVKSVDQKKASFTITFEKRDRTFLVDHSLRPAAALRRRARLRRVDSEARR